MMDTKIAHEFAGNEQGLHATPGRPLIGFRFLRVRDFNTRLSHVAEMYVSGYRLDATSFSLNSGQECTTGFSGGEFDGVDTGSCFPQFDNR